MTAYSPAAMKAACDAAKRGMTVPACAARAGINVATIYRWQKDNEEFRVAFQLAKLEGRAALEERALATAERDDGKHAIDLLQRRHPKAWGRQDRVKLDAKVETTTQFKSNAEALLALDRMRAALKDEEEE